MQIYAWNINKKTNSTYQPPLSTAVTIEGYMRNSDAFSMYTPNINFNFEDTSKSPEWNYFLIPNFGNRYYWVVDWTHSEGIWKAILQCDVLATYKQDIGNSDLYVLRSSYEFDRTVVDSRYPIKSEIESFKDEISNVYVEAKGILGGRRSEPELWEKDFTDGCYVISVTGPNATGLSHYLCTYSGFKNIIQELYDYNVTSAGIWDNIPEGYAKAIANPYQYITSVKWYPSIILSNFSRPTTIKFGYYEISSSPIAADFAALTPANSIAHFHGEFPLRIHPQSARGRYVNSSPYTDYTLTIPPFGEFPIDANKVIEEEQLDLDWYVDYTTGDAELYLTAGEVYLGKVSSKFGIDITITQATVDFIGAKSPSSLIGGGVGALKNAIDETFNHVIGFETIDYSDIGGPSNIQVPVTNHAGAASAAVGGFISYNPELQPKLQTLNGSASYLAFSSGIYPKVHTNFFLIVDEDNESFGRPLCSIRKPKDIPGYIITESPRISTNGTEIETLKVINFLIGGFFYE